MSPPLEAVHHPVADDEWLASICEGSEMGELICAFDWASTPLGAPDTWSIGLRTAVGVCLSSRFPMLLVWGPDLIKIYNDGYRPILGTEKHPSALGAPAREIWPEIWDEIGPLFDDVITTGRPTWSENQLLVVHRNGYPEECAFTFSYGAVFDDDGSVGGVLDVVTETTDMVVSQRRLACMTDLASALVAAEQVTDVCLRAAAALDGSCPDIAAADLYLLLDDDLVPVASNRRTSSAPVALDTIAEAVRGRSPS